MTEDKYISELVDKYEPVIEEMQEQDYSEGITDALDDFEEEAEALGVNTGGSEARDALIAFAAKGIIEIETPTGNSKIVDFRPGS